MKAVRIHKHGTSDVLRVDDIAIPKPQTGEVLIKIKAAALNHLDIFVRKGIPGVALPLIMGSDAAGEVVETGENVTWLKKGDEVIHVPFRINPDDPLLKTNNENLSKDYKIPGEHVNGVQAEYVCIPDIYALHKPMNTSWAEAAAFPLVALTAYHMLCRKVTINKGDWILVYGASSGVGSAAIQIAKSLGANVITTVSSPAKAKLAKSLGADRVLNYEKQSVGKAAKEISGGGVDFVFEHTGELTWKESLRSLKTGGKIITCGATTGYNAMIDLRILFNRQQQIIGSTMGTFKDMIEVIGLVNSGKVKPVIGKTFHFKDVNLAHDYLESGQNLGKVVLNFD
jgi:NADPH:quinone reductase-like Zn-dependent oxidoreductase